MIAAFAACSFDPAQAPTDAPLGVVIDANAIDGAMIDAGSGSSCSGSGFTSNCVGDGLIQICFGSGSNDVATPTTSFAVASTATAMIDSTMVGGANCTALLSQSTGQLCVVAATSVTIDGTLHVMGPNAIAFASLGPISITGMLDVSGHMMMAGPGGDTNVCVAPQAETQDGGGAGGSFITVGGNGGDGSAGSGGVAAAAIAISAIQTLRGGCAGGDGAGGQKAGGGGGAVDFISAKTITITGHVLAGGGGGAGAGGMNGGGGAGAGGLIVFDSDEGTQIQASANVDANGGGGGQGQQPGHNGMSGADSTSALVVAAGGNDPIAGGPGGSGASGSAMAGSGQSRANSAGGGGGGGAGAVLVSGCFSNAGAVSPAPLPY